MLRALDCATVLDAGCGEGFIMQRLRESLPDRQFTGVDLRDEAVEWARGLNPDCELRVGSVYSLPFPAAAFDATVCLEVLEHLDAPERALDEIARVTRRYLLVSTPWEPYFSLGNLLRLRNVRLRGRDPEHMNFWDKAEILRLIGSRLTICDCAVSLPWVIVLAAKR